MHPAIMRQLTADHIRRCTRKQRTNAGPARRAGPGARTVHATKASGQRGARYDDPRLDEGRRTAITEQSSTAPLPVMAGSPPDSARPPRDARRWTIATDQSHAAGGLGAIVAIGRFRWNPSPQL